MPKRIVSCGLMYEPLESRAMLSTLRIGAWNTFNRPNSPTDELAFQTVIEAVGAESVLGNTRALDILAVSETDTGSATSLDSIFDELYQTDGFQIITSGSDGGNDRTGIVYNSNTVSLLDTFEIPNIELTHNAIRAKFRPIDGSIFDDFYVYSVHLKSGSGTNNRNIRAAESDVIRATADLLSDDANVIYAGDFNFRDSDEAGWENVFAPGAGAATDVANSPGDWDQNSDFKHLHTQSVSSINSRFDFQFVSDELRDGWGIDYVEDSFTILGNDGSHLLNGSIDTGSGASPEILDALMSASDHLPIFSDFEFGLESTEVVVLDDLNIIEGSVASGMPGNIDVSDDLYFGLYSAQSPMVGSPPLSIELSGVSDFENSQRLTFSLETSSNSPNIQQTIELFNFSTNQYDSIDERQTAQADAFVEVIVQANVNEYIDGATGEITVKLDWIPNGPVLFSPWSISIDFASVEISESPPKDAPELPDNFFAFEPTSFTPKNDFAANNRNNRLDFLFESDIEGLLLAGRDPLYDAPIENSESAIKTYRVW